MVSLVDGLAGAVAVGSSGASTASRCCVGGGNRGLGSTLRGWLTRHIVAARLLRSAKTAAFGANSAFRSGAPRSMKMGTTRSPCPYDVAARHALQSANVRRPAILHYASCAAVFPISRVVRLPSDSGRADQYRD